MNRSWFAARVVVCIAAVALATTLSDPWMIAAQAALGGLGIGLAIGIRLERRR